MLSCELFELVSQRGEAAGLDLDQQAAAEEIDDETVDDPFDAIVGTLVPVLELSVQRTLVEHSDRGALTFVGSGHLEEGAHDDAPSAPRRSCLRQITGRAGPAPPLTKEFSLAYRARVWALRPATAAGAGSGCRTRAEERHGFRLSSRTASRRSVPACDREPCAAASRDQGFSRAVRLKSPTTG